MNYKMITVSIQYPEQQAPIEIFSRDLGENPKQTWNAASEIVIAVMKGYPRTNPLVTIKSPEEAVPKSMQMYCYAESYDGRQVIYLGNTNLIKDEARRVRPNSAYKNLAWGVATVISNG